MLRRLPHIVCSLWLAVTALIPGQGWTLCVSPSGHVAVEFAPVEPARVSPGAEAAACREDCGEERCEACHDVSLASAERACSRRDVVAVEFAAVPAQVEVRYELEWPTLHALPPSPVCSLPEASHRTRILRC
jgi:hypothetical protein